MNMKDFHAWVQAMKQPGSMADMNIKYQNRNQTPIEEPKKEEPEIEKVVDKEED